MAKETFERAIQSLENPDESVREKAIVLLVRTQSPRALPFLEKTAHADPSLKIRFLAKEGFQTIRTALTRDTDLTSSAETRGESERHPVDVQKLATMLSDDDARRRLKAVKAAMALMDPQALTVLGPQVRRERNLKVKGNIVLALGLLGGREQIPVLLHYLEHKEPHLRTRAAQGLSTINDVSIYPRFVHSLGDRSSDVRSVVFSSLIRLGKPKLVKLLTKMGSSPQKWMRLSAAKAAGRFRTSQVLPVLASALKDDEPKVRKTARASLRRLHRKGLEQAGCLLDEYRRAGGEMTSTELELPTGLESPLNDPDPRNRLAEIQRILNDRDVSLMDLIRRRIEVDDDEKVRASLILALGKLGGSDSLGELKGFLSSPHRRIRASAVEALSFIEDPSVIGLLVPLLDDSDNRTRANAIVALRNAPHVDLIGPLEDLIATNDRNCKLSAIYAICELGLPKATALLDRLTDDPDELVRHRVEQAHTMLADERLTSPSSHDSMQSGRLDIPQELTAPAPQQDASPPSTATGTPLTDLMQTPSGVTEAPQEDAADDSDPSASVDKSPTPPPSPNSATKQKSLPGMRTEIDALFEKAELEKDKLKNPPKNTRGTTSPKKTPVEQSRQGFIDSVRDYFSRAAEKPSDDADSNDEPSDLQLRNVLTLGVAIVIVFFIIYFFGFHQPGYDEDEFFDPDDF